MITGEEQNTSLELHFSFLQLKPKYKQKDCYPVLKIKLLDHLDEDTMSLPLKIFKTGLEGKLKERISIYVVREFFTKDDAEWFL